MSDSLFRFPCSKCRVRLKAQPIFAGKSIVCPKCKTRQFIPQPVESEEEVDLSSAELRKLEQFPPAGVKRPSAGPRPPVGPPLVPVPGTSNDPRTAAELSPAAGTPATLPKAKAPVARAQPASGPPPAAVPVTPLAPSIPAVPPPPAAALMPTTMPPPMPAPGSLAQSLGDIADLVEIVEDVPASPAPSSTADDDDFDLLEIIDDPAPSPPAS